MAHIAAHYITLTHFSQQTFCVFHLAFLYTVLLFLLHSFPFFPESLLLGAFDEGHGEPRPEAAEQKNLLFPRLMQDFIKAL